MRLMLKGIGVCNGTAKGKVKLLRDVTKLPEVEDKCIIVTPFFTPIITMLLSKASGMVTDFGGKTSHAAIIAREFGVPCVVGVNEATKLLKEGQEIFIDGEKGEVYEL